MLKDLDIIFLLKHTGNTTKTNASIQIGLKKTT
jgi:hypothetical protein